MSEIKIMVIIDRRRLPPSGLRYQSPPLRLLTTELLEYNNMLQGGHRSYWYCYVGSMLPADHWRVRLADIQKSCASTRLMKREQIQAKFKAMVERTRQGGRRERRDAVAVLKGMVETYPSLRDYARLLGLKLAPGLTREFPWLAPPAKASAAKTRHTEPPGGARASAAWVKPPTPPGWEYRQCYKPKCHCMRGGPWHGPYRYAKHWHRGKVSSEYLGREIVSRTTE